MSFAEAVEACRHHIWEPEDYTDMVWLREKWGAVQWGDSLEDIEDGDGCSTDRFREVYECGNYVIGKIDDGCGGWYQAIFSLDKELKLNDFKE